MTNNEWVKEARRLQDLANRRKVTIEALTLVRLANMEKRLANMERYLDQIERRTG